MTRRADILRLPDEAASATPLEGEARGGVPLEREAPDGCVLVVGNFDGVHRGHQAVLLEAVQAAESQGLVPIVLTFDPHPAAVVGGGAPPVLTTLERRAELVGALGVERMVVRTFDAAFSSWQAERFARELIAGVLRARVVVVGQNFRFGTKRAGDLPLLRALGAELGFDVRVHAIASDEHGPFSSTRVRDAIAAGDLAEAERVLGRPHELSGPVVHGDERGRTINFPTANLEPVAEMLPPDGVYAVWVDEVDPEGGASRLAGGVTNIGVRPTVGGGRRTVETFVLGFSGDLYGVSLRLNLVARLRPERKFGSLDELKLQIVRDCAEARRQLGIPGGTP
jgi:riboflavin kinase/FMN adenylyltransferase